jgi:hypothetical protein
MTAANDNGVHFQRLDPTQIDVVLGSARAPRVPKPTGEGRGRLWVLILAGAAIAAWGMASSNGGASMPQATVVAPATAAEPEPPTVVNTAIATQVVNQATVVIINAPTKAAPSRAEPAPAPTPADVRPQGLVSAQYLAQFKAGANRPNAAARPYQIASVTIREWDGPNRYVAKWRVQDNVIDQSSVCFNFPDDSIEHRECRRAAQQYFRTQCKDWTRRLEKARDQETRAARGQLCEVAQGFAP